MPSEESRHAIRAARPDEYPALRRLEFDADTLFETVGMGPFNNDESENHLERSEVVLVIGDPPVGFICIELVDGSPHIWQLSVHPRHGRKGVGRILVGAAIDWARRQGFSTVTLTTFRDVPWNRPFYESVGFVVISDLGPELAAVREHERSIGDDDLGVRVAMALEL